jgi:hypothetical protein
MQAANMVSAATAAGNADALAGAGARWCAVAPLLQQLRGFPTICSSGSVSGISSGGSNVGSSGISSDSTAWGAWWTATRLLQQFGGQWGWSEVGCNISLAPEQHCGSW